MFLLGIFSNCIILGLISTHLVMLLDFLALALREYFIIAMLGLKDFCRPHFKFLTDRLR